MPIWSLANYESGDKMLLTLAAKLRQVAKFCLE